MQLQKYKTQNTNAQSRFRPLRYCKTVVRNSPRCCGLSIQQDTLIEKSGKGKSNSPATWLRKVLVLGYAIKFVLTFVPILITCRSKLEFLP